MRKHIQSLVGVDELRGRIDSLKKKREQLKRTEIDLKCKIDAIEKRNKERARIEEKLQQAEIDSLAHQRQEVGAFLGTMQQEASAATPTPLPVPADKSD